MKKFRKFLSTVVFTVVASAILTSNAFAVTGEGCVTASELNMRVGDGMGYEVIDAAPKGSTVYVTYDNGNGWYQVTYNGKTGYMSADFITFGNNAASHTETYTPRSSGSGNGSILGYGVHFRSGPSMDSATIGYFDTGDNVQVNGACGAWYEVVSNGQTGYIYGDYIVLNGASITYTVTAATISEDTVVYSEPTNTAPATPQQVVQPVPPPPPAPAPVQAPSAPAAPQAPTYNSGLGQAVVAKAMEYQGIPYVWGGTSPEEGFDCSGLVYYVYGQLGYSLNRVAQSMYYNGTDVPLDEIQSGDILLFGSSIYNIWHAAIYVGDDVFIHAPHSGAVVSTQTISGSYGLRLVAARRIG